MDSIQDFIAAVDAWFDNAKDVHHYGEIVDRRKEWENDNFRKFLDDSRIDLEAKGERLLKIGKELPEALEANEIDSTGVLKILDAVENRRGHRTVLRLWPEVKAGLQRVTMKTESTPTTPEAPTDPDILTARNAPGTRPTSPRDAVLLAWYEAAGTETFHSYVNIVEKWNGLPREKKTAICPATPGPITKATAIKSVATAKKDRGDKPKKKAKRKKIGER